MSLHVEQTKMADGSVYLSLYGAIDDRSDISQVFDGVSAKTTINLQRIERFNSMGIMKWVPIILAHSKKYPTIIEAISYPVVMQANSVRDLFGSAEIRSCQAPYYCMKCNSSQTVIVTSDEFAKAKNGIPEKMCNACNVPMSFDELDGYFSFFNRP